MPDTLNAPTVVTAESPGRRASEAHSPALRFEWLTRLEDLERLEARWRALEESESERLVFGGYDYLVPWYRHHARVEGAPLVGAAWRGSDLVGLIPLAIRRATLCKVPVRRADSAGHDGESGDLLLPEGGGSILAGLLESLLKRGGLDVLLLNGLAPGSERLHVMEEVAARHGLALEREEYRYATIDLSQGFEVYEKSLRGSFRGTMRRRRKRAVRMGGYQVVRVNGPVSEESLLPLLARIFAISERSWKARNGDPMKERYRQFYTEIARRFGQRGMLDFSILTVGGVDASYIVGLVERGVYHDVTISYVEEFAALSPGMMILQEVARRLAEEGVRLVVSHGDHAYKNVWASRWVPQVRANLFMPGLRGTLSRMARVQAPAIMRQIRSLSGRPPRVPSHDETTSGRTTPEGPSRTS